MAFSLFFSFLFQRLCLNGSSGQEIIISTGLETVEALAFEPLSQLLYWVNAGIPKIEVQLWAPVLQRGVSASLEQPGSKLAAALLSHGWWGITEHQPLSHMPLCWI